MGARDGGTGRQGCRVHLSQLHVRSADHRSGEARVIRTRPESAGAWLRIGMSAPPGNILSLDVVGALRHAIWQARALRGLKWLTIESTGKDFSFGASIPEHLPEMMP